MPQRHTALIAFLLCLLTPAMAAAGGGGANPEQTQSAVVLLLAIAGMYLIADFVVDWIAKKFLFLAGVEYILLGVLIGGQLFSQVTLLGETESYLPFVALGLGWLGLMRGMEGGVRELRDGPAGVFFYAWADDVVTASFVGGGAYGALTLFGVEQDPLRALFWSGVVGSIAATGATGPMKAVRQRYDVEGPLEPYLSRVGRVGDLIAILFFGGLLAYFRGGQMQAAIGNLHPGTWVAVYVGLGIGLGLLFAFFLGPNSDENSRFLSLVGITTFAAGSAFLLDFSPLCICVLVGVALVNQSSAGVAIQRTLLSSERPISLLLYVFAGALWIPPSDWIMTLVAFAGFVLLRAIGKRAAGMTTSWEGRRDLGRGLLGFGDTAVAMAISLRLAFPSEALTHVVYTVVLLSVVVQQALAPRALRNLLVDTGSIRREQEGAS